MENPCIYEGSISNPTILLSDFVCKKVNHKGIQTHKKEAGLIKVSHWGHAMNNKVCSTHKS